MIRYINVKTDCGLETVDEVDSANFDNISDFRKELKRLIQEYGISGHHGAYSSRRSCKGWK